jgi:hypothetical protein
MCRFTLHVKNHSNDTQMATSLKCMSEEKKTNEEYVNEVELDELMDVDGTPVIPEGIEVEVEKIEPSIDDFDAEDFEDAIGSEESTLTKGDTHDELRSALQGGGDDRNDE